MMDAHQTVELTPQQDAAGWAILDELEAAKASGDVFAEIAACGALIDWQLSVGLLTRDELRAMSAPYLLEIVGQLDEFPEGRAHLQQMRTEAMELLNGNDYAERAGAALLLETMAAVQAPRVRAAQLARNAEGLAEWLRDLHGIEAASERAWAMLMAPAFAAPTAADVGNIREAWRGTYRAKCIAERLIARTIRLTMMGGK